GVRRSVGSSGPGGSLSARPISLDSVVGRADELALLDRFVGDEGDELALTIEGEAGIGKTTLWRAGVEAATDRSYIILSSRPGPADVRLSYAALRDLLDGVVPAALEELPEPQRRALAAALLLE